MTSPANQWRYMDVLEFFAMAATILGAEPGYLISEYSIIRVEAALWAPVTAFDGQELYKKVCEKAGILAFRILDNRPLPNNNVRMAWVCLDRFVHDNHGLMRTPSPAEIDEKSAGVIARTVSEREFLSWICTNVVS